MPLFAKNSRASVIIYEESTYGVAPAGGSPGFAVNLISTDISAQQGLIESAVINGTRQPTRPFLDRREMGGGLTVQADPIGIGFFLKWLLGAPTTTGAGPYSHVFKIGAAALPSLTIERYYADIGKVWRASGCKFTRFSFDVTPGGLLQVRFDIMGADEVTASSPLDATPFTPSNLAAFRAPAVAISEGGSTYQRATRFGLTFDNALEGVPTLYNGGAFYDIVEGISRPTGTFTTLVADETIYAKAAGGTETSLLATFTAVGATATLAANIPEAVYELKSPGVSGGTGPVPVDFAYRGYHDDDAGGSAIIFTLTNTQASYAAIP